MQDGAVFKQLRHTQDDRSESSGSRSNDRSSSGRNIDTALSEN
jgi:hypothetical protein